MIRRVGLPKSRPFPTSEGCLVNGGEIVRQIGADATRDHREVPRPRYLGSKKSARMAVPPTFSVECSSASRHIDAPAAISISSVSPDGAVNFPLPSERK